MDLVSEQKTIVKLSNDACSDMMSCKRLLLSLNLAASPHACSMQLLLWAWDEDPEARPAFFGLVKIFGLMLYLTTALLSRSPCPMCIILHVSNLNRETDDTGPLCCFINFFLF